MKRLTAVELDILAFSISPHELETTKHELLKAKIKADLEVWKVHLIQALNDSPSKERKSLRWKVSENRPLCANGIVRSNFVPVGDGELEVLSEISL